MCHAVEQSCDTTNECVAVFRCVNMEVFAARSVLFCGSSVGEVSSRDFGQAHVG